LIAFGSRLPRARWRTIGSVRNLVRPPNRRDLKARRPRQLHRMRCHGYHAAAYRGPPHGHYAQVAPDGVDHGVEAVPNNTVDALDARLPKNVDQLLGQGRLAHSRPPFNENWWRCPVRHRHSTTDQSSDRASRAVSARRSGPRVSRAGVRRARSPGGRRAGRGGVAASIAVYVCAPRLGHGSTRRSPADLPAFCAAIVEQFALARHPVGASRRSRRCSLTWIRGDR
jgi:hypothetical protein